ncbi:MAG: WD40 repeat domain-containing protein [Frankia sp.]
MSSTELSPDRTAIILAGHTAKVWSVAFTPDGATLATASGYRSVRLWHVVTGQQTAVLTGHTRTVTSVTFFPDGGTLATASYDDTVRLWDLF